jgi:hypothetical protein
MAHQHRAELTPSKVETITAWVRAQPWFEGDATAELDKVAAFRFDDPEGRVGIETLLVVAGDGPVLQVPLTYRDAPLAQAEAFFLGAMEHSVLGTRYVYDGMGDPVYLTAVATAALSGGTQADEYYEVDGAREFRAASASATGSGSTGSLSVAAPASGRVATREVGSVSVATMGILRVALARVPGSSSPADAVAGAASGAAADRASLTGTWEGHQATVTFAVVERD